MQEKKCLPGAVSKTALAVITSMLLQLMEKRSIALRLMARQRASRGA